jgi:hypothetical protein
MAEMEHEAARRFARALIPDAPGWGNPDLAREFAAASYLCVLQMKDRAGMECEDLTLEFLRLPTEGSIAEMRNSKSWRVVLGLMKLEAAGHLERSEVLIMVMAEAYAALRRLHGQYPFEPPLFEASRLVTRLIR